MFALLLAVNIIMGEKLGWILIVNFWKLLLKLIYD